MARHLVLISAALALVACQTPPSDEGVADDGTDTSEDSSSNSTATSDEETTEESETDSESGSDSTETGAACGDGVLDADEECDDSNTDSFDGCSAGCVIEHPVDRLVVGNVHNCVSTTAGEKCWGLNGGALGLGDPEARGDEPGEMGAELPVIDVGYEVAELAAGDTATCGVGPRGELKCWGWNSYGQLGLGDLQNRGDEPGEMGDALPLVELDGPVSYVAQGELNGCALLDQALKCWGFNGFGQLGLGDTVTRGDEPGEMGANLPVADLGMDAVEVVLGSNRACARDGVGGVKCWGAGFGGLLGLGDDEDRGDEPGEMGDALPFVDLGTEAEAAQLSAFYSLTCAVLASGGVKCWGATAAVWADVTLWPGADGNTGDEPGEMGDVLPELVSGDERDIVEVATGYAFFCVRLDDGAVRCVGRNEYGQLGQGHTDPVSDWLEDVPDTDLGEPAVEIGAGRDHVCALMESGNVKCWGCSGGDRCSGALGYGDEENRGDEAGEMGAALPYVPLF